MYQTLHVKIQLSFLYKNPAYLSSMVPSRLSPGAISLIGSLVSTVVLTIAIYMPMYTYIYTYNDAVSMQREYEYYNNTTAASYIQ